MAENKELPKDIQNVKEQSRDWFLDQAVPLWSEKGRQPCGLCAEKMDENGEPDSAYFRVFVQARHIYALAVAGRLGYTGPWRERIEGIITAVLKHGRRPDGFFVHKLDKNGDVSDSQTDLYDQAFMLLAFSECAWALDDDHYFDQAQQLLDNLEQQWKLPIAGFYEGQRGDPNFVHQNPHMHLLESFISLYQRSGRECFRKAAGDMVDMAQHYFIDPKSGGIIEDFHKDMTPCLKDGSYRMEPGHCFEWSWLCEQPLVRDILGDGGKISDGLVHFARRVGIDSRRGVVINDVLADGKVLDLQARLWPQTERIKAGCLRGIRLKSPTELQDVVDGWRGLTRYFNPQKPGLWFDRMSRDGHFANKFSPASSFYHIACAIEAIGQL